MLVRIPLETYIFILNFSLPPRSEQVNGAVANEIKHVHSPEVIVVLDPRYDLSYKALYISTCSIALNAWFLNIPSGPASAIYGDDNTAMLYRISLLFSYSRAKNVPLEGLESSCQDDNLFQITFMRKSVTIAKCLHYRILCICTR